MNLKALFNKNYFKENLKKSLNLLAFFLVIVPMLNILMLVLNVINKTELMNFGLISGISYFGLFIIPVVLAVSLFGFVFKQKSVDFVMSKPLSRKSIYFTNIWGGILVLCLFTLINSLILFLFNIFTPLVIPLNLIIDYALFFFISYVFVFVIAALAISLAGNLISSIVIMLIVAFIYPFFALSGYIIGNNSINFIECTNESCKPSTYNCAEDSLCLDKEKENKYQILLEHDLEGNFTAPSMLVKIVVDDGVLAFDKASVLKMTVLSIIYIGIGYICFRKRQMEENETSFKSPIKHYLIKSLTFLPVCFLTYMIMEEFDLSGIIIAVAIAVIYYLVYDLITRKEIYRFLKSMFICIATFIIFNTGFYLFDKLNLETEVNIDDIKSISIVDDGLDFKITDRDYINRVFKSTFDYYGENTILTSVQINNKSYFGYLNFKSEDLAYKDKLYYEYQKEKIKEFDYDKIDYISLNLSYSLPITKELKNLIKDAASNYQDLSGDALAIYNYKNHKYEEIDIPISTTKSLYKYVVNYINTKSLKNFNDKMSFYLIDRSNLFEEIDVNLFDYIINKNLSEFKYYLDNKNTPKLTSDYLTVEFDDGLEEFLVIISDPVAFKKEFETYKSKVLNDPEYQILLKEYQNGFEE